MKRLQKLGGFGLFVNTTICGNSMSLSQEDIQHDFERISASQEAINTSIEEINQQIEKFKNWAWSFVIIGLLIMLFGLVERLFLRSYDLELDTYGTFVGGAVASLWSLAGLFFIYVAFLGQRQQLLNQQLEIKFSQLELKATRLELEGQKEQMIEQNLTLRQQRFENTFFQLMEIHSSIVSSMDLRDRNQKSQVIAEGRDCFETFYKRFEREIRVAKSGEGEENEDPKSASLERTEKRYEYFFEENQNNLGHYFRNLYHIVKFIDNSSIDNKKTYTNFVRAQLSSYELAIIFYNCLTDYGYEKFKPLIEKYALLKNMSRSLIFNQEHLSEYNNDAFGY